VRDGYRASDVMYRIRGLLKEALPKRERGDEERRINADAVLVKQIWCNCSS
jgi:hypothetical protein